MPHSLLNPPLIMGSAHATVCTPAVRELKALLTRKYGLPAHDLDSMDERGLIRTAATLDFLANNLPPKGDASVG
jgi:hypothetical protein